jgi:hypothetical protein
MSHARIQSPFHCRTINNRCTFPNALVVQIGAPIHNHPQPIAKVETQSQIVSICPGVWALRLQRKPTGSARNANCSPQETQTTSNMGRPWIHRMIYWSGNRTLTMLQSIHYRHRGERISITVDFSQQNITHRHLPKQTG